MFIYISKNKIFSKPKFTTGFTLIELLMVISIIALLSSISFGYISSARAKSRDTIRASDMNQINTAASLYYEDKGVLPDSIDTLVGAGYLSSIPKDPKTGASYVFKKVGNKNAYVVSTSYENIYLEDGKTPQKVGIVIGDIDIITLCLLVREGNIGYPSCNSSNESNDQILGITKGRRGSGGVSSNTEGDGSILNSCPFNNVLTLDNGCVSCGVDNDYLITSCGDKPTSNPCNVCSSPERHLSVGAGCWYCVRTCGSLDNTEDMILNLVTNECECPSDKILDVDNGRCI